MSGCRFLRLTLLVWLGLHAALGLSAPAAQELRTVAEESGFTRTSTSEQAHAFLAAVVERAKVVAPEMQGRLSLETIGHSVEGRPLGVVRLVPAADAGAETLRVLIIANIHAGECDGKEAMLALLRDLAETPQHRFYSQPLELVILPNYNPDGNDRIGPDHRPGQVGPEIMGVRENAQQLDLNRDFMKIEAPETQALIAFANRFDPHVFIDCHTTNGSQHGYPLTFDVPHHPSTHEGLRSFLRQTLMPAVTEVMAKVEIPIFYYGNFDRDRTRWTTYGHEPRYSTEYFGQRGVAAILSESYSYATYEKRIQATHAFVEACIDQTLERRDMLLETISQAQASIANPFPLRAEVAVFPEKYSVLAKNDDGSVTPIEVDFWGDFQPTESIEVPAAYVLPPDASWAAERVHRHGLEVHRTTKALSVEVCGWTCRESKLLDSFQKHRRQELAVGEFKETREIPAGAFVIPVRGPQARLVVQLLEPRGTDSLIAWNFLDDRIEVEATLPMHALSQDVFAELKLELLETIEPTERLSLDKVYGPKGRIDYSGAVSMGYTWADDAPHTIRARWGDRPMRIDAPSFAMTEDSARQAEEDPSRGVTALAKLEGIDQETAERLMRSGNRAPVGDARLLVHQDDLLFVDLEKSEARWLTRANGTEELAEFSPDGRHVAYVRGNNLYVVETSDGSERALTTEGDETHLFGKLDWVYQEELYGRGNFKGFWWSPSGSHIALLRLDETPVDRFTVTDHIPVRQELEVTSYPKAGDGNPIVGLGIAEVESGAIQWVDLGFAETPEPLISRVDWAGKEERLTFQIQDREQTFLELCAIAPGATQVERWVREVTGAWVDTPGNPNWLKDGSFLWLSSRSGTQQVELRNRAGELVRVLTQGPGEVRSIIKIDQERGELWFAGTLDTRVESHAYRVPLAGGETVRVTELGWNHSIRPSPDGEFAIDFASRSGRPIQVRLLDRSGRVVRMLDANLPERLAHVRIREPELLQVEARDGHRLDAMIIKPYDFDPAKKYPVLIYQYSGPQAPTVRNQWSGATYLWHQMLAQHGYVIWMCDNRSATEGSAADAWPIHRNLGRHELMDIEDGVAWLKSQPWIDGDRIGIWGWSYGGYMTAYALTHSKSFRLGISGAPVTDWRNYDTIYTERYMGLPSNNPDGYRESSVVEAAENLHGHLLLIHGSMDDNVHLTNTMQLVYRLQQLNKPFDLMVYPKSRHGVTDTQLNRHLRELMTRTVLEKL